MEEEKISSKCPHCDDGHIYEDDPVNTGACIACSAEGL